MFPDNCNILFSLTSVWGLA